VINNDVLTLPHPRAHERAFVLVPWLEIDPAADLVGHGPVADLVAALDTSGVRRRDDLAIEI
jgi:2-amino-4-hydroxy-6-hydroxymethyldihydropteridine diphosphokinase